jgi:hypothetical protein
MLTLIDSVRDGGHVDALSFTGAPVVDELELAGARDPLLLCSLSMTVGPPCQRRCGGRTTRAAR